MPSLKKTVRLQKTNLTTVFMNATRKEKISLLNLCQGVIAWGIGKLALWDQIKGREENRRLFPVVLVTSQAFPFLMITMLALSSISQSTFISCKIVPVKCHSNNEIFLTVGNA